MRYYKPIKVLLHSKKKTIMSFVRDERRFRELFTIFLQEKRYAMQPHFQRLFRRSTSEKYPRTVDPFHCFPYEFSVFVCINILNIYILLLCASVWPSFLDTQNESSPRP